MDKELFIFIVINILLIAIFFYIAYSMENKKTIKTKNKELTLLEFINRGSLPSFPSMLSGLVFGIVFGFMDNFGLWMGIDVLEKYMPGGMLTKSALGNTYSDFIGATLGSFIGIIAKNVVDYDESDMPIWIDTIGIIIGCLLGLMVGRLLTGKS
jgi:hypothetical protein